MRLKFVIKISSDPKDSRIVSWVKRDGPPKGPIR